MTNNSIIELKNISKIYQTGDEDTVALCDINLVINKSDFVAIMGPSGSGKSSLMHILGLLDKPTKGEYILDGKDVSKLGQGEQAKIRNQEVGFVFQQFNLLPRTSIFDNVLLPTIYGDSTKAVERAKKIIKEVGLEDKIKSKTNQLSGGQIQRVAIARALINDPAVILADEPTGNLDTKKAVEIMEIFKKINSDGGTVILITHEPDIAKYARRVIKLVDGKIVEDRRTQ